MNPTEVLYFFIVNFIRIYKWLELQILKLFQTPVEVAVRKKFLSFGVVFHVISPSGEINQKKLWTPEEEKRVLYKCPYDKVIYIRLKSSTFFAKLVNTGPMAMGDMFMDGEWDFANPEESIEFFTRLFDIKYLSLYFHPWNRFLNYLELLAFNFQTPVRVWEVAKKHYDLGNDLYESFLDPWLQYTCGYWAKADNLNDAQIHKMHLLAKKLDLQPGMRVLDIGCGWGTLCKFLAQNYGVECVGISVGEEGIKYGKEQCKNLPVEFRLQDWRDLGNEKFDRIVSVGVFEHIGHHNYRHFLKKIHKSLKDDGVYVLHTIGTNNPDEMPRIEQWIHTYIFPNGQLPYPTDMTAATNGLFILEDWHNFGNDYHKTLEAWHRNFNQNWPKLATKYGSRFQRMWNHYLCSCAGAFKARQLQLWQLVLSKNGLRNEYRAAR